MKSGLISAAICALSIVCFSACSAESNSGTTSSATGEKPEVESRKPAPQFTLKDVQGRDVSLAEHRGKIVVLDFWATWCPPCIYQVPELNKLWLAHRDLGDVEVIGVAVDFEGVKVVGPWVAEQGVEYPIVIGDEALAQEFGALGFPTLAIIDREGNIESLHVGLIEFDELEGLLKAVAEPI